MCKTEICAICQHKSWTGCGKHVGDVMNPTPKTHWCTCDPIDVDEQELYGSSFPPKAGTGFAKPRKSSVS